MLHLIDATDQDSEFPDVETALREPNGLLAVGGALSPKRLINAYRAGIFPWFNEGQPVLWWSPDPRAVLFPQALKISRSLNKTLRQGRFAVTMDRAFTDVIAGCAAPRRRGGGAWITAQMIRAYQRLHALGIAHSVETWCGGELVGGLYGVALGKIFSGESMFNRRSDASKVAFVHLVRRLAAWEYALIDCQIHSQHIASLGAENIPRREFTAIVRRWAYAEGRAGCWGEGDAPVGEKIHGGAPAAAPGLGRR